MSSDIVAASNSSTSLSSWHFFVSKVGPQSAKLHWPIKHFWEDITAWWTPSSSSAGNSSSLIFTKSFSSVLAIHSWTSSSLSLNFLLKSLIWLMCRVLLAWSCTSSGESNSMYIKYLLQFSFQGSHNQCFGWLSLSFQLIHGKSLPPALFQNVASCFKVKVEDIHDLTSQDAPEVMMPTI